MKIKSFVKKYNLQIYFFFLIFFSFTINQYYAYQGVLPVDSFSTFNTGYDILNGAIPFKDYWVLKGIILDFIQAGFFKILGVSWFSYATHASAFNSIFAITTFYTFISLNLNKKYAFIYSILSSVLMYPTYGIPFTDHTTAIFCMLAIYSLILAINLNKKFYWYLIPIFIFLAFFTKQTPTGYIGILISIITSLFLIKNFEKEIVKNIFFGCFLPVLISFLYIFFKKIPLDAILTQYFFYPISLGETRLEWLLPLEFQRFVLRHKLIYIALAIPIYLLIKNMTKNIFLLVNNNNLTFMLLFGTLIIFISHQLMTINGLYIFFLIPVFSGFSHLYSYTFKNKKVLINFFLILSFISTIYYHQKYIVKRDTLLLRNYNLENSINAGILSKKLENLRWLTINYPKDPNLEAKNLLNSIELLKLEKQKKMIVTDYQFISVVLGINDNSAARIWWRHHIYPANSDYKLFYKWKEFLLQHIERKKIKVIYTVLPLAGEENIFDGVIDENCFTSEMLNKIVLKQTLKKCNDLKLLEE